jgi:hypothetical protein
VIPQSDPSTRSPRERLDAFLQHVRLMQTLAPVMRYARDRSTPKLVRLLDSTALQGDTLIARDLLATCVRWNPCGLYGCCLCGRKLKRKAKREALKAITARAGGIPQEHEVSWVTVDGPTVALEASEDTVRKALKGFRKKIERAHSDHLRDTSWYGFFDISLRGMMHWHGVILHPDQSRSELVDALDLHFPEDRQAYVEEDWHKRPLMENMDRVLDYALVADRHVPTLKGKPIVDADTAGLIARRIVLLQYMCQRGIQGIRLKLNMKSQNYWKSDVLHDGSGEEIEIPMDFRRLVLGRKVRGGNRGRPALVTGPSYTAYEIEVMKRVSKARADAKERERVAWLHGWLTGNDPPPDSSAAV